MKSMVGFSVALVLGLVAATAGAQQPNMEIMLKWSAAEIVHYNVVAEFNAATPIMRAQGGVSYSTQVQDRVEVGFDWNQNETKLVGAPVVKNFPTTVGAIGPFAEGCPSPRVTGAYEHANVTAVRGLDYNPALEVVGTRTYATGQLPARNELGCGEWQNVAAQSGPIDQLGILVMPTMYLAMPNGSAGQGVEIGADGKTIKQTTNSGWTYTYTLSIK